MTTHFSRLSNAYAITLGDRLLPGVGRYGLGAVVPVMPDEASARAWVNQFADDLVNLNRGVADIIKVGNPWKFMRRAAGEGLAGIEGANTESFPERFMFMVRVEEAGSVLPTVLASITDQGWDTCLTRTGARRFDHAEVLHWQRFDVIDSVTGQWGQRCPFRGWQQGETLYELGTENIVVLLAHVPLLGPWNSTEGAFAFFTSEEAAIDYREYRLADGRSRMLYLGGQPTNDEEAMASLRPRPVRDLSRRLRELSQINPGAAWCVNPAGHREDSACGRWFDDELAHTTSAIHRMAAVSGIWQVIPGNRFKMEQSMAPWSGKNTIRWSGGQSLQLLPLDRSFVLDPGHENIELGEDLTESEAEEFVAQQLDEVAFDGNWEDGSEELQSGASQLDQFHIVWWDTVTGEGVDCPWRFSSFLAAAKHLAAHEREHDSRHRIDGAVSCSHIGFSGSQDDQFEGLRSARFRLGLRRLALRVLRFGYRPSDAADLVALCNGTLGTIHIEYAGFAKDLLWSSPSEQQKVILEALEIDEAYWTAWAESADFAPDPKGERLARQRISEDHWNLLVPKTRHFLSTAFIHLEEQGHAPQLDYAPISLEVVKALEVELGEVLGGFRAAISSRSIEHDPAVRTEIDLSGFLAGGKAPTLGAFPYLLGKPKPEASPLRVALYEYLIGLPNGSFLTSSKFLNSGLRKVADRYRNGGAHDSAISEATCRECIEVLIGSTNAPGYIPLVAKWKTPNALSPEADA
jgi:hypothetical protein